MATLTPDVDLIPYKMTSWIQIAGSVFFGESKNDEIYVCICLDGCSSVRIPIYREYGFRRENIGDSGIAKYYKLEEACNIANEVEDIVITLAGESIANSFVSDEVFTKILQASIAEQQMQLKERKKRDTFWG